MARVDSEADARRLGWSVGDRAAIARKMFRLIGLGPAILLVVIAVWETAVAVKTRGAEDAVDWAEIGERVQGYAAEGDAIVFSPPWLDPLGRQVLGDSMTAETWGAMDLATFDTVWEVARRGHRHPELTADDVVEDMLVGGLRVRQYRRSPTLVVTDFLKQLSIANRNGRVDAPRLEEVGFRPRWCAVATPVPGKPISLEWSKVALGDQLVGYVGLADVFTRRDIRDPGRFSLKIDDKEVVSMDVGVEEGWKQFSVATPQASGRVVLVFDAAVPRRRLCFAMQARQP